MKKVLFIDRDNVLILEPKDEQIDSLEKLVFYPGVFTWLGKITKETDFELVMVTNQDGLGTDSFPEDTFWPAHNKMLDTLKGEGIEFDTIKIDRSFGHENKPTRKPGTGMLKEYFSNEYDLSSSFVIGDRVSDMELAKNLGAKGIWLTDPQNAPTVSEEIKGVIDITTNKWEDVYHTVKRKRVGVAKRTTKETDIDIRINLDGSGKSEISTGIAFFDHMLEQISKHGLIDLSVKVQGDLEVDEHHTIEDTGIALGEAFLEALGDKRGIERYGFCLPMDDCLAQVALDFGGRNWIVWEAEFKREMIGKMPTEMFFHFFKSFSDASKSNLNIKAEGTNEHHKIEAIFKSFAKAIKMAVRKDPFNDQLPSTKGVL
ncbi:MAG: bifunctional histidinol-phosphatase/imidazoleglycerol-phosphate dehydratase HisB [Bacteroidota bacterium]